MSSNEGPGGLPQGLAAEYQSILIDRADAPTLFAKGKEYRAPLDAIPMIDQFGRHAMLVDLEITGSGQFDTNSTTMTAACRGYEQLSLIDNVRLRDVTGWEYFAALNGRDFRDDAFIRNLHLPVDDPASLPDAAATDTLNEIRVYIQLADFDDCGYPSLDGAIPVSALVRAGRDALTMRCATGFANTGAGAGEGVTWDGFSGTVEVRAGVVWSDFLSCPAPWQLDAYEIVERMGSLQRPERLHAYATLLNKREDTGGQDVDDYSGITVEAGGVVMKSGMTTAESFRADRHRLVIGGGLRSFGNTNNEQNVGPIAGIAETAAAGSKTILGTEASYRQMLIVPPAKNAKAMPQGKVAFNFTTRSTHTTNRFLHRTIAAITDARLAAFQAAAGVKGTWAPVPAGRRPPAARLVPFLRHELFGG